MSSSSNSRRPSDRGPFDGPLVLRDWGERCSCPKQYHRILEVESINKNTKGLLYFKCSKCGFFSWLYPQNVAWTDGSAVRREDFPPAITREDFDFPPAVTREDTNFVGASDRAIRTVNVDGLVLAVKVLGFISCMLVVLFFFK